MSENEYSKWNQMGFIPGPEEKEEDFLKRMQFCLNLEDELSQKIGKELPFEQEDKASLEVLQESSVQTLRHYGIDPTWVPLFFSNTQLKWWQAGCAWIFQLNNDSPTAAFLQLRASFREKTHYLGIYERSEVITHEMSHIGRMEFKEPQFEEIFAYQSSSSSWRRWLGGLIESPKECSFFILILGVIILTDFALFSVHRPELYILAMWLKLIPVAMLLFASGRLWWRQRQLNFCLDHLQQFFGNPLTARHLAYRLTDQEIKLFARSSPEQIKKYIEKEKNESFRWNFLTKVYEI